MRSLEPLTGAYKREHRLPGEHRFGVLYGALKSVQRACGRLNGTFSPEDSLTLACVCEPSMYFLRRGCVIPHPFGITLSADEIGADCLISQNVTIGTSGKTMNPGEFTKDKPRLGHLVRCYAGALISGNVTIGRRVIVAAHAIVTKDVPDDSIVYGVDVVRPLQPHHRSYLRSLLWMSINEYRLVPGLVYQGGDLFVDRAYAVARLSMVDALT